MSIMIIINSLGMGGAERLVVDDVNEMLKRGLEVKLVTLKIENKKSLADQCQIKAEDWYKLNIKNIYDIRGWLRLLKLLRAEKPDVLITHLWFSNTLGRICGKLAGIKKIITFEHNVYDTLKSQKMFWMDRLLQSFSTRIVAVSEAVKKSLLKHGIKMSKVEVITNGIDISKYDNVKSEGLDGYKKEKFTFVFIGRLIHQKGVDVLLRAFAQVPGGELLIVGEGEKKVEYTKLARELSIQDRVKFLGARQDIPQVLAFADCFVLPSRYEGLPMVLLEAVAAGKAIIVSDFESAKEVIKNGENGIIVPKENIVELAKNMNKIREDNELFNKLQEGIQKSSKNISIQNHVDKLMELCK